MNEDELAEHERRTDRVVTEIFVFPNGQVAVVDQFGQQMSALQGRWTERREAILAAAPPTAKWNGVLSPREEELEARIVALMALADVQRDALEDVLSTPGLPREAVRKAQLWLVRIRTVFEAVKATVNRTTKGDA